MAKLSVLNIKGEKVSDITLNAEVWGIVPNDAVLYDAITLTRNSQRQGTHETKTRSEVSVVEENHGDKKEQVELVKVLFVLLNGIMVVSYLDHIIEATIKK